MYTRKNDYSCPLYVYAEVVDPTKTDLTMSSDMPHFPRPIVCKKKKHMYKIKGYQFHCTVEPHLYGPQLSGCIRDFMSFLL